jgi:hypothetical protein
MAKSLDYVLLPHVFGDMGGKGSKKSPKPSLPSPRDGEPKDGGKERRVKPPVEASA